MRIDFSDIEDVEDYVTIPEGVYLSRIADVRQGHTRDGSPRWSFRLEVAEGEYAGRTAAWDSLVWSERGLPRVKQVLEVLGFDVSGTLDVQPEQLNGLELRAQYLVEAYEDPLTGARKNRMRVPYRGYTRP